MKATNLKRNASRKANALGHDMRGRWEDQRDGTYLQDCEQCGAQLIVEANEGAFGGQAAVMSCKDFYDLIINGGTK